MSATAAGIAKSSNGSGVGANEVSCIAEKVGVFSALDAVCNCDPVASGSSAPDGMDNRAPAGSLVRVVALNVVVSSSAPTVWEFPADSEPITSMVGGMDDVLSPVVEPICGAGACGATEATLGAGVSTGTSFTVASVERVSVDAELVGSVASPPADSLESAGAASVSSPELDAFGP